MLLTENTRFLLEKIKTRIRSWNWTICPQGSDPTGSKTTETKPLCSSSGSTEKNWLLQQTWRFNLKSFRNTFWHSHRQTNEWEANFFSLSALKRWVWNDVKKMNSFRLDLCLQTLNLLPFFIFNLFHKSVSEDLHEVFSFLVRTRFIELFTH